MPMRHDEWAFRAFMKQNAPADSRKATSPRSAGDAYVDDDAIAFGVAAAPARGEYCQR